MNKRMITAEIVALAALASFAGAASAQSAPSCDPSNGHPERCYTPTPMSTATPSETNTPAPRFVDNGDGTVTDNQTGLMWEKKENLDGTTDVSNQHDADNPYQWTASLSAPDG